MKNRNFQLGIILFLISLFYLWETQAFEGGDHWLNSARSFPILLGSSLLLFSLILMAQSLRRKQEETKENLDGVSKKRGIFYILWTSLYIFLAIPFLGFVMATFLYMFPAILFYKETRWIPSMAVSIGTLVFIYVVFSKWMYIQLP